MKKKTVSIMMAALMAVSLLAGCGSSSDTATTDTAAEETADDAGETADTADTASSFDSSREISVYSREDGSGTRGAFIELFGVEQKDADGNKVDYTTEDATITNNTSVMLTGVAGDTYAIGYVSLGSLNDTVKAVEIDGAAATVENIKSDTYKVYRPFNIVTNGDLSETAQDFVNYILSAEGQAIVEEEGYITIDDAAPAYEAADVSGSLTVAGSSSVSPVMEKLAEAYMAVSNVTVEIQTSDSTTGVTSAIEGTCDIGMASRELKDSEVEEGAESIVIAQDGIAVIVNNDNPIDSLTAEQVMSIYTGETTVWSEAE